MITYRCNDCSYVFSEDEIERVTDQSLEFWGTPCHTTMEVCPFCNSNDFIEVESCLGCDRFFELDELTEGLCPACYKEENKAPRLRRGLMKQQGNKYYLRRKEE